MTVTDSTERPCPNCGTMNAAGTKYCSKCGTQLISVSTLSIGKQEIDERDPTLRVVPDEGKPYTVLLLEKLMDMGSEPHQTISIQAAGVAPRHARLALEGGKYRLYSIAGGKAVLVNGQPVDTAMLKDGDMIRLQNQSGTGASLTYSNPAERGATASAMGKVYSLNKFPYVIGRDPEANMKLDYLSVSWHNSEIAEQGGKHILTDLGSTNGTFVNDRRITGAYRLQADDAIRIGGVQLVYKGTVLARLPTVQTFNLDAVDVEMTYRAGF